MNLKEGNFKTLSVFLTLNLIVFLSACWYVLCFFKNNSNICVIANQFTSSEINETIKNIIDSGLYKSKAIKIAEELRSKFPAIKAVEKKSKSNCRQIIKVKSDLPSYQVNKLL